MKRTRVLCVALSTALALGLAAPPAPAADALGGPYHGTVILGPVLLDGRYPLTIGASSPGMLDVTTSPTGALTARVTFAAQTEDAVGQVVVNSKAISLTLRGKTDAGRVAVSARLQGSAFVGTVKLGGKTAPCRIEIGSVAPIRARYQVSLASTAKGAVAGTGTLTVGRETLPVAVRGSVRKQGVSLTMRAGRTLLTITNGRLVAGSVLAAKWSAKGFGAALKGRRRLTLDPG